MTHTTLESVLIAAQNAQEMGLFGIAFDLDNQAEDLGAHSDDRVTCWICRTWATEEHITSDQHLRGWGPIRA